MVKQKINKKVLSDRLSYINEMIKSIKQLPIKDKTIFFSDPKNIAAAESYLRRSLEAFLDLGRHIISKGFGLAVIEYKEIAAALIKNGIVKKSSAENAMKIAGYRNRMVHFYQEISDDELYDICLNHLDEVLELVEQVKGWLQNNQDKIA